MALPKKPNAGSIETAKKVGISLRQLYYWVDVLHVLHPRMWRHGMRRFRHFSPSDVRKLKAVKRLVEHGYTLQAAVNKVRGYSW